MGDADPTEVTPGDIDDFARLAEDVRDDWAQRYGAAGYLVSERTLPSFGAFSSASAIAGTYKSAIDGYRTAFGQLETLVQDVADAAKAIAKNYRDAESIADATVGGVDKALSEAAKDDQPAGTPGT